jgi:CarboxypepD_reg-like domain/Gram-negative bacterial TonB protein C-terminal
MADGTLKYVWNSDKMEHNNADINYSAEDIQRYLGGKMTPLEMNALEKAALDDPFLAEALEGYSQLPETDWKAPLQSLKDSFAAGTAREAQQTKIVSITTKKYSWLKYAAAVLLLIGGTGTYLLLSRNGKTGEEQTIAAVEKTTTVTSSEAIANIPVPDDSTKNTVASNDGDETATAAKTRKTLLNNLKKDTQAIASNWPDLRQKDKLSPVSIAEDYKKGEVLQQETLKERMTPAQGAAAAPVIVSANKADDVVVTSGIYRNTDVAASKSRNAELRNDNFYNQQVILYNSQNQARNNSRAIEVNRNFTAQVVDANNNPLPFANVNIKNEGFGTYTDVRGNVRLISTDTIIPVEIKSLGFKTQNIVLRSNLPQNRIVLQQEESSGYREKTASIKKPASGVISRRAMLDRDSTQDAEPADGWDNYDTYVANNLAIPDNVVDKNIHGSVELSFDVRRNGTIANVKVDKSLCGDCDELAKRIVEQGPQWKLKKGKKAKAKVIVRF